MAMRPVESDSAQPAAQVFVPSFSVASMSCANAVIREL